MSTATTVQEPETPMHVGPDSNMDLDNLIELDEKEIDDLNLDPTMDETPSFTDIPKQLNNNSNLKRRLISEEDEDKNTLISNNKDFDSAHDYQPRINFKSPFSSNNDSHSTISTTQTEENNQIGTTTTDMKKHRKLSMSQQSKFITYVDSRLMEIQRKFVQSRGLSPEKGYKSLTDLLHDIKSLLDFIWYSIDNKPHTDYLLHIENFDDDTLDMSNGNTTVSNEHNFGQTSFIIKIADDLMDYIEKFDIYDDPLEDDDPDADTVVKIFKIFYILDRIFRLLISGQNENKVILNSTDRIRFMAIAERSRMRLPQIFEKNKIHGYHFELSKIYELSLDFCAY